MEMTMTKPPLARRINPRMIVFSVVILTLIGFPLYMFVREKFTGGIINRGDYLEVNLKATGNFVMDPAKATLEVIPQRYRELDGKRVMFEGEMYAPDEAGDQVSRFQLVYSIQACCFSGPPKVQERVFAVVPNNGKVDYHYGQVRVFGTLRVNLKREQGLITSVYEMDVESVEPV